MREPLQYGVMLAAAVASIAALCSCGQQSPETQPHANEPAIENNDVALPPLPVAEPPLDRAAILIAAFRAASAAALGQDDKGVQRELEGKRIAVRIRFGCSPDAPDLPGKSFAVRFDPNERSLRLRAKPDILEEPWIASLGQKDVEAVEGFWLARPWLLQSGCPVDLPQAAARQPEDSTDGVQAEAIPRDGYRVGIAQFFNSTDSRLGRRDGRPYESTVKLSDEQKPSTNGYDLELAGRLRRLPDGRVIACEVKNKDSRPDCLVSAEIDQVRMLQPDSAEVIAEWRNQ